MTYFVAIGFEVTNNIRDITCAQRMVIIERDVKKDEGR